MLPSSGPASRRPARRRPAERRPGAAGRRDEARRTDVLAVLGARLRMGATGCPVSVDAALEAAEQAVEPLLVAGRVELARRQFVAGALARVAVETDCDVRALSPAVAALCSEFAIDRVELGLAVLADPLLLDLPVDAAATAIAGLLEVLAPARQISVQLGERGAEPAGGGLLFTQILCWARPCARLAFLPDPGREAEATTLAALAARVLGTAFQRDSLIEGNVARSDALAATAQRRLTRLGFDLHDGPLQDVAVLTGDLDTLSRRIDAALGRTPLGRELLAQLEDAVAVARFLDGDLRDLATSLDGTGLSRACFDDVVAGLVRKFTARTDAETDLAIVGETDSLTDSQKITLTRVIQEALANIREHSGAQNVRIDIDARSRQVHATISDDGAGFDVEEGMRRAGSNGRMGLAGMVERVRLLGGVCDITSRPGAGTHVSLTIARWVPPAATRTAVAVARPA